MFVNMVKNGCDLECVEFSVMVTHCLEGGIIDAISVGDNVMVLRAGAHQGVVFLEEGALVNSSAGKVVVL